MDKMKLAHDFAMKLISVGATNKTEDIIRLGWEYADAMQKEADEREPKGLPQALSPEVTHVNNQLAVQNMVYGSEEWQPDWSQAPDDAIAWEYLGYGGARWHTTKDGFFREAPTFEQPYYGPMILRKRPQ